MSVLHELPPRLAADALVEVPCGLCGGRDAALERLERGYRIVRCAGCGHVYVSPRPDRRAAIEQHRDYLPADAAGIEAWRAMMEPCESAAADLVAARAAAPGPLLDVGCGFGFFLSRMRERGYDVQGLEVSPTGRRFARERLGLDVQARTLEEEPFPDASCGVVTAFYVIEHVFDPLDFLGRARALLRPGGTLLLRYPDTVPAARLLDRLGLGAVPVYDAPYHLSAFTPASITSFLERAGFTDVEHAIGGHTLPPRAIERWISTLTGRAAALLERASGGRFLLPGVSKCCLARREGK